MERLGAAIESHILQDRTHTMSGGRLYLHNKNTRARWHTSIVPSGRCPRWQAHGTGADNSHHAAAQPQGSVPQQARHQLHINTYQASQQWLGMYGLQCACDGCRRHTFMNVGTSTACKHVSAACAHTSRRAGQSLHNVPLVHQDLSRCYTTHVNAVCWQLIGKVQHACPKCCCMGCMHSMLVIWRAMLGNWWVNRYCWSCWSCSCVT